MCCRTLLSQYPQGATLANTFARACSFFSLGRYAVFGQDAFLLLYFVSISPATLVENNICMKNGARCLHIAFGAQNVDFFNKYSPPLLWCTVGMFERLARFVIKTMQDRLLKGIRIMTEN